MALNGGQAGTKKGPSWGNATQKTQCERGRATGVSRWGVSVGSLITVFASEERVSGFPEKGADLQVSPGNFRGTSGLP